MNVSQPWDLLTYVRRHLVPIGNEWRTGFPGNQIISLIECGSRVPRACEHRVHLSLIKKKKNALAVKKILNEKSVDVLLDLVKLENLDNREHFLYA